MNLDPISLNADVVHEYWNDRVAAGQMTWGTGARYRRVFASYLRFVRAHGCPDLEHADERLVSAFIYASGARGPAPANSTSRFRLTVLRDAYAGLAASGLCVDDPTVGITVRQLVQQRQPVPLTPAEVGRLRRSGRTMPRDHLRPAAVELALAGATHLEVARAVVTDLDLKLGCVLLGDRQTRLEPFALTTLVARVAACRRAHRQRHETWRPGEAALALSRPFSTYPNTSIAPGVSSNLSRALTAAGLRRAGLRPASLREYAANRVYAQSGVEGVARSLGLDSLDVAFGLIDEHWQAEYGPQVRASGE